jgi:hypothetical protein
LKKIVKKEHVLISVTVIAIALTLFAAWSSSGTPLDSYIPKNMEEEKIIALIEVFHKARTELDVESYLACLDHGGRYMFSGHMMVSKEKLATLLPRFWAGLKAGSTRTSNAHIMPICRENLNGNFFDGDLYDPVIEIDDSSARVTVRFQTPVVRWRSHLFISLKKTDGEWLINGFEWAIG